MNSLKNFRQGSTDLLASLLVCEKRRLTTWVPNLYANVNVCLAEVGTVAAGFYIEEVATRAGLTPRTLRFWEEKGLLAPSARTEGGMRLYSEADIERARRIRELRDVLGLSLDVIGQILSAEDELDALRRAAFDRLPEERRPYIQEAIAILESQVKAMAERVARINELRGGYEERLYTLRERLKQLEG